MLAKLGYFLENYNQNTSGLSPNGFITDKLLEHPDNHFLFLARYN